MERVEVQRFQVLFLHDRVAGQIIEDRFRARGAVQIFGRSVPDGENPVNQARIGRWRRVMPGAGLAPEHVVIGGGCRFEAGLSIF